MKKASLFIVALSICFLCFSTQAYAKDDVYTENYFRYTIQDESITMIGYYGRESEITVPAMIANYPVNTIAAGAFSNSNSVKKINLPDTIMSIEEGAFSGSQTVVLFSNTDSAQDYTPQNPSGGATINPDTQEIQATTGEDSQSNTEQSNGVTVQDSTTGETYVVEEKDDTSNYFEDKAESENEEGDAVANQSASKTKKTTSQTSKSNWMIGGVILAVLVCAGVGVWLLYHRKRTKK